MIDVSRLPIVSSAFETFLVHSGMLPLLIFHQPIPAVPTPYLKLTWRVQGRYLEFHFSPGGVHCPWKAERCIVIAFTSVDFLCV